MKALSHYSSLKKFYAYLVIWPIWTGSSVLKSLSIKTIYFWPWNILFWVQKPMCSLPLYFLCIPTFCLSSHILLEQYTFVPETYYFGSKSLCVSAPSLFSLHPRIVSPLTPTASLPFNSGGTKTNLLVPPFTSPHHVASCNVIFSHVLSLPMLYQYFQDPIIIEANHFQDK